MVFDKKHPPELKVLIITVERNKTSELEDFLLEKQVRFHYMINAMGTARGDILQSLGLSGSEKTICAFVTLAESADGLVSSVTDRFSLGKQGNGVIYTIPVSGISTAIAEFLDKENNERTKSIMKNLLKERKNEASHSPYSLVVTVINQGFSEKLMDAARATGARGGTIINARHAGIEDSVRFFGVTLQAEKEIVAIVVPTEQKQELMRAISQKCGMNTEAHGIIISLPVENCAGIEDMQNTQD